MAYMNRFINDAGFEEWTTTDAAGNEVTCYAGETFELHTKNPICICGQKMHEIIPGRWTCIPCNITKLDEEFNYSISLDEYEMASLELDEDYGEFEYDDGRMLLVGVPDWYYFYAKHARPIKK